MIALFQWTLLFSSIYILFALIRIFTLYLQDKKALKAWREADQIFQEKYIESLA